MEICGLGVKEVDGGIFQALALIIIHLDQDWEVQDISIWVGRDCLIRAIERNLYTMVLIGKCDNEFIFQHPLKCSKCLICIYVEVPNYRTSGTFSKNHATSNFRLLEVELQCHLSTTKDSP